MVLEVRTVTQNIDCEISIDYISYKLQLSFQQYQLPWLLEFSYED